MPVLSNEIVSKYASALLPYEYQDDFVTSICRGISNRPAVVWLKEPNDDLWIEDRSLVDDLLPEWVSVPKPGVKAGNFEEHDQGHYYCADLSSIILGLAVERVCNIVYPLGHVKNVVDVCAAPGGKSVVMWRGLAPEILFCNEVVRKRVKVLISNLSRCQIRGVHIYSFGMRELSSCLKGFGDVVLADVPCSAQSLGAKAQYPFSASVIRGNVKRQRMILDACVPIVRVGGLLAYITCTFSPKENEENIAWFIKRNPDFTPLSIPGYAHLLSTFSSFPSYRIWPYQGLGRGGYVCILQKGGDISPFDASPFDVSIVPPKSIYRID